jgi:TonB family protein
MNSISVFEELDRVIDVMLARPETQPSGIRPEVADLVGVARELRHLPRTDFRTSLMVELEWEAAGRSMTAASEVSRNHRPTNSSASNLNDALFGRNRSVYPVSRINMAASVGLHAALLLFMGMGFVWVKSTTRVIDLTANTATRIDPYPFPESASATHGGGAGGARDHIRASQGSAPRFAHEQLTPPVVLPQNNPRIQVEATIVGPPDLHLPESSQTGDPLSRLLVPSAGVGVHGGIGAGEGGGVGDGSGNGLGPGHDGGLGGGIYEAGEGVTAPRAVYKPEPDYSDEARTMGFQGVVVLWAVIGTDGRPARLGVARSLGMGLDEKALEAVNHWRFEPARKAGRPVPAKIYVEVDFHLF